MAPTMDVLMFLHLFVYPLLLGANIVGFSLVVANMRQRWQFMLAVVLFWTGFGLFILAVEAHINYQTLCS
jgi:hypothetical protein